MNTLNIATLSPLLILTFFFMVGIAWASFTTGYWNYMIPLIVAFIGYNSAWHQKGFGRFLLASSFLLLGAFRYQQQSYYHEMIFKTIHRTPITVAGTVTDVEISDKQNGMQIITIALTRLTAENQTLALESSLWLKIKAPIAKNNLLVNDHVVIPRLFVQIGENQAYKRYLIKENLIGFATIKKPLFYTYRPKTSGWRWLQQKRERVLQSLKNCLSFDTYTLFCSIFWGKKEIDPAHATPIKENFKTWGIVHYLARSGLHVVLFILFWHWICSWIPLPFLLKELFFLFLIVLYHFFSWASVSFIRSILLFILYKLCNVLNLQVNMLHSLSLTALVILFINPFQLFFLDFQLSFGLTFSLLWLNFIQKH